MLIGSTEYIYMTRHAEFLEIGSLRSSPVVLYAFHERVISNERVRMQGRFFMYKLCTLSLLSDLSLHDLPTESCLVCPYFCNV